MRELNAGELELIGGMSALPRPPSVGGGGDSFWRSLEKLFNETTERKRQAASIFLKRPRQE